MSMTQLRFCVSCHSGRSPVPCLDSWNIIRCEWQFQIQLIVCSFQALHESHSRMDHTQNHSAEQYYNEPPVLWLVTVDMKIEIIAAVIFTSVVLEFRLNLYHNRINPPFLYCPYVQITVFQISSQMVTQDLIGKGRDITLTWGFKTLQFCSFILYDCCYPCIICSDCNSALIITRIQKFIQEMIPERPIT